MSFSRAMQVEKVRRRILYLMHVDWRWIKQRPQFLAEELALDHDMHVLHRLNFKMGSPLQLGGTGVQVSALLPIPWSWKALRWATNPIQRHWVGLAAEAFKPDTIWITHPSLMEALPAALMNLPIVYDCMDDALGFTASKSRIAFLTGLEQKLVNHSSLILCSSFRLCELLVQRYGHDVASKITLVRNGLSESFLAVGSRTVTMPGDGRRLSLAYIGTIAEWLDFDALVAALEKNASLEFHLVGPVVTRKYPKHERLKLHGPVSHADLPEFAARFDAYVMPFRLSPLIESVDPVKLYEYLAFGKEVFSVHYAEVERFADFVHFYRTRSEFIQLMDELAAGKLRPRNPPGKSLSFLAQNTWRSRGNQISELFNELAVGARR